MEQNAERFELVEKRELAPKVILYRVAAPEIATSRKAGQFVMVRVAEGGERIPLTIADADAHAGTITLVVQEVGLSTARMASLRVGDTLATVVGPLGAPTHVQKYGTVACVGGGIGIAPLHPIAQALREAGNRVVSVLAARNKELLFFRTEMRRASDEIRIWTDDGSEGQRGLATQAIEELHAELGIDLVVAIGPVPMMDFVSRLTKKLNIPTQVSLNPVMVDGTGMCGGCRVTVGKKTKFVCVDGPEFDGHSVDFQELAMRQALYREDERRAHQRFHEEGK